MHSTLISWNNAEWHAREHLLVPAHEEKQQHLQLLIRCFITQRRGEERIPAKLKTIESFSFLASPFILIQKPQKWLPLVPQSRTRKTNWWCWQQHSHLPLSNITSLSLWWQTQVLSLSFTLCFFLASVRQQVSFYFPWNVGLWDCWRPIQALNVRPIFCQHFGDCIL